MTLVSLKRHSDWGLLALRLAIGAVFLYHGLAKWPLNPQAPWYMTVVAIAEPLGGLAMILGLLTQWAALGLGIIMLGAIYMKMTGFGQAALDAFGTFVGKGGAGWEFDLVILAGCVALLFMGGGKMALDAMMGKK